MTSDDSSTATPAARPASAAERQAQPADSFIDRLLVKLGFRSPASMRDDLVDALSEGAPATDFSPQERAMLRNVLRLRTNRVQDVMVPRADIVAVSIEITLGELLRVFRTAGHSRLPVYAETLDDPRGMVHIRDFLDYMAGRAESSPGRRRRKAPVDAPDLGKVDLSTPLSAARILRPVLFVPPSMPALDLLVKMQTLRTHMALVIDEYGGTDGLVSIEDLVEIVVGEIEDEHDEDETPEIVPAADGSFIADARASLEDAAATFGVDLAGDESAEDVDTLGGLIATLAGRVPVRGEIVAHSSGLEFEILDADPRRIKRLRVHPAESRTPPAGQTLALPAPDAPQDAPSTAAPSDR
ncbi:hemolysin family protein [Alsobacter sp. R-9]